MQPRLRQFFVLLLIVLFAFGLKTTLADVDGSLGSVPALGLCGGVALYLLAHVALRLRIVDPRLTWL